MKAPQRRGKKGSRIRNRTGIKEQRGKREKTVTGGGGKEKTIGKDLGKFNCPGLITSKMGKRLKGIGKKGKQRRGTTPLSEKKGILQTNGQKIYKFERGGKSWSELNSCGYQMTVEEKEKIH